MSIEKSAKIGPFRFWSGYKQLRVPLELYSDIKIHLEALKNKYTEIHPSRPIKSRKKPIKEKEMTIGEKIRISKSLENHPKAQKILQEKIYIIKGASGNLIDQVQNYCRIQNWNLDNSMNLLKEIIKNPFNEGNTDGALAKEWLILYKKKYVN